MRVLITLIVLCIASTALAYDWEYVGMDGVNVTTLTVDPEHDRVFVGTLEGFWYFDQGSGLWTSRDAEGWIGRTTWAVDYHDTMNGFVVTGRENAYFKGYLEYSEDLGVTENFAYESTGGRVTDIIHVGENYWACTASDIVDGELLRSFDGGRTWQPEAGHGFHTMSALARNFGFGEVIIAGDSGLKINFEDGFGWQSISENLPGADSVHCVRGRIPGGDALPWISIAASTDNGLFLSLGWNQWVLILETPCRDVAPFPSGYPNVGDRTAAVTMDGRIMVMTGEWADETGDLPGTPIAIAYSPFDRGLYVATAEDGIWRVPGVGHEYGSPVETPHRPDLVLSAYPNPFNPGTTLRFSLEAEGPVDLRIFDVSGREVARPARGIFTAGEHTISWQAAGLPSGTYLADLKTQNGRVTQKLVLLK